MCKKNRAGTPVLLAMKYFPLKPILALLLLAVVGCRSLPPLHQAVQENKLVGVLAALDNGAGIDEFFGCYSALMRAVSDGRQPLVDLLLSHGADPNLRSPECTFTQQQGGLNYRIRKGGETALMFAPTPEIVRLLIGKGANVNAVDLNGETALVKAAGWGQLRVAEALLAGGASVATYAKDGQNASLRYVRLRLQRAATPEDKQLLLLLRKHGADDLRFGPRELGRIQSAGPLREYVHKPFGHSVTLSDKQAADYFENPSDYDERVFCESHKAFFHVSEFEWKKTGLNVWQWYIVRLHQRPKKSAPPKSGP